MFVAIAKIPSDSSAVMHAAQITDIAAPDVSRLLAGTLPRVLVRATPDGERIASELNRAGFIAFPGDEKFVLKDKDRVVARNMEWTPKGFVVLDGQGQRHECLASNIEAFIKGSRVLETSETTKSTARKLDIGKTLVMGGIPIMKKVVTTEVKTATDKEAFVLIQRWDDSPEIILYERRLNYQCLGTDLQPSMFANMVALTSRLRGLAPEAPLDDRIGRPGYLAGLPTLSVDALDLAIFLVTQARLWGC